jgi:MraZ protein
MDAKNRVTIPSDWLAGEESQFFAVPDSVSQFLIMMPREEFDQIEALIMASDAGAQEKRASIRQFYADAHKVTVDKQGRVLLPDDYCKRTALSGEVMIVGSRSRIEIWNTARWNETCGVQGPVYQKIAAMIGL